MNTLIPQILTSLRRILFYDGKVLEWIIRILITLNIILPGFPYADHAYPLDVLIMTALGYWFAVWRLKLFSLFFLLFAFYITSMHLGWIPGIESIHHE
jgi:hypothetical protein